MDTRIIREPRPAVPAEERLAELRLLEDQLAHEFMDDEERQELRDRVLSLRRRLGIR